MNCVVRCRLKISQLSRFMLEDSASLTIRRCSCGLTGLGPRPGGSSRSTPDAMDGIAVRQLSGPWMWEERRK
jgi:hypothetical protein